MKKIIRNLVRKLGFELERYTLATSEAALIKHLLNYYCIDLVFDVGANRGQYGKFLRGSGYYGRIVSFEPLSSTYSQLLTVSNKDPLWEIAPRLALGDQEGEIALNIAGNSESSSVLQMLDSHIEAAPNSAYSGSERVNLSTIDTQAKDYIKNEHQSIFLKIDVQGFEKQVLEGAQQILPLVKGIQIELSFVRLYESQILFDEMLDYLTSLGYELYSILPVFADPKTGKMLQANGIFFKP